MGDFQLTGLSDCRLVCCSAMTARWRFDWSQIAEAGNRGAVEKTGSAHNMLRQPWLSAARLDGSQLRLSLPGLLAALAQGTVGHYPRLRPHQRHVWHAFLVHVAVLALAALQKDDLPEEEETWRIGLRALLPEGQDEAPWCLVAPPNRPALLQAPLHDGDLAAWSQLGTPDEIDVIIASKNHDIKRALLPADDPELWLYALVSVQTQGGFHGKGLYGVSRLHGGFGSRMAVSQTPGLDASAQFRLDCREALIQRRALTDRYGYRPEGGLGLTWLVHWDGDTPIDPSTLDVFHVEICRRLRLVTTAHGLAARSRTSTGPRIEGATARGAVGDLWTPCFVDADGPRPIALDGFAWSYRRLVQVLFPDPDLSSETVQGAPLQSNEAGESGADASTDRLWLARALIRAKGRIVAYAERSIPVPGDNSQMPDAIRHRTRIGALARQRLDDIDRFTRFVLYPAILFGLSGASLSPIASLRSVNERLRQRASTATAAIDDRIDAVFFDDLAAAGALAKSDAKATAQIRQHWIETRLQPLGASHLRTEIDRAVGGTPSAWRVHIRARSLFDMAFQRHFGAKGDDAAANRPDAAELISHPDMTAIARLAASLARYPSERRLLRRQDGHDPRIRSAISRWLLSQEVPLAEEAGPFWLALAAAMARTRSPIQPENTGWALAAGGYSETRFLRLLSVDAADFPAELGYAARVLAARDIPVDWRGLAGFGLARERGERQRSETLRDQLAEAFYRRAYRGNWYDAGLSAAPQR